MLHLQGGQKRVDNPTPIKMVYMNERIYYTSTYLILVHTVEYRFKMSVYWPSFTWLTMIRLRVLSRRDLSETFQCFISMYQLFHNVFFFSQIITKTRKTEWIVNTYSLNNRGSHRLFVHLQGYFIQLFLQQKTNKQLKEHYSYYNNNPEEL